MVRTHWLPFYPPPFPCHGLPFPLPRYTTHYPVTHVTHTAHATLRTCPFLVWRYGHSVYRIYYAPPLFCHGYARTIATHVTHYPHPTPHVPHYIWFTYTLPYLPAPVACRTPLTYLPLRTPHYPPTLLTAHYPSPLHYHTRSLVYLFYTRFIHTLYAHTHCSLPLFTYTCRDICYPHPPTPHTFHLVVWVPLGSSFPVGSLPHPYLVLFPFYCWAQLPRQLVHSLHLVCLDTVVGLPGLDPPLCHSLVARHATRCERGSAPFSFLDRRALFLRRTPCPGSSRLLPALPPHDIRYCDITPFPDTICAYPHTPPPPHPHTLVSSSFLLPFPFLPHTPLAGSTWTVTLAVVASRQHTDLHCGSPTFSTHCLHPHTTHLGYLLTLPRLHCPGSRRDVVLLTHTPHTRLPFTHGYPSLHTQQRRVAAYGCWLPHGFVRQTHGYGWALGLWVYTPPFPYPLHPAPHPPRAPLPHHHLPQPLPAFFPAPHPELRSAPDYRPVRCIGFVPHSVLELPTHAPHIALVSSPSLPSRWDIYTHNTCMWFPLVVVVISYTFPLPLPHCAHTHLHSCPFPTPHTPHGPGLCDSWANILVDDASIYVPPPPAL